MPRVTVVKSANKPAGKCGRCGVEIKKGDSYKWWKFRYGGKRIRCAAPACHPKPSDLTQSAFLGTLYDIQETLSEGIGTDDLGEMAGALRDAAEQFRDLGGECQGSLENMPEGLQQGDTGQLLQDRSDRCEEIADELESAADEIDTKAQELEDEQAFEDFKEGFDREEGESDTDYNDRARDEFTDGILQECRDLAEGVDTECE